MVLEQPSSHENSIPISSNFTQNPSSPTDISLISLNISAQINDKLNPSTFLEWSAQFEALLIGSNLIDYVTRDKPCPHQTTTPISSLQKIH